MAFWRKPTNVVTLFHNPKVTASHDALALLQRSLRYDKLANPRPCNFDFEVIEPPLGMTGTQRATILRALMLKEDRERAARPAKSETATQKEEDTPAEEAKEGSETRGVLEEVAKQDTDWTQPLLPKLSPPLAVWWQADDVANGSLDEVKALIDRLRADEWASREDKEPSLAEKVKHWFS